MLSWIILLCTAPAWAAGPDSYSAIAGELVTDKNHVIAVAELTYADGRDSADGRIVAERITTAMGKSAAKVIERSKIEQVLGELKLQGSGAVDQESVKSAGKLLGADCIVVGTLTELPEKRLELNLRMVGVESGQIVSATTAMIRKDWLVFNPPQAVEERIGRPISLGELVKRKNIDPKGAILLGHGCGCDIYYEGDGSFMRWVRGYPHGAGGKGTYIKREDSDYCNFIAYIEQLVQYKYPKLKQAWRNYRRDNGI